VISLSDTQLRTIMAVASALDQDKRSTFLQRIAAQLEQRGRRRPCRPAGVDGSCPAAGGVTRRQ